MRVDELNCPCPFANGGSAPLGRARPYVAGSEHAGDRRLEDVVGAGSCAGQNESVVVPRDGVTEPVGARQGAEEQEQVGEPQTLAAFQRDRLELAVGAVKRGDPAAVLHWPPVALELAYEVVRHRSAQIRAPMQQRDERAAAGEPDGGL